MTCASEQSLPQGWCNRQLHDLCYVIGGGTPSRSQPQYWNGDIPWASVKDFSDEVVFLHDTKEHITQEGLESSASTLIQANTPVVCTRMAVGRCALTTRPTAINQDLKALLLRDDFDSRFFIRLLKFHGSILDRVSVGSTVRGITTHDLLSLALCYPDKSEQSRIALVLDTVDEAIAKTEAVIAKLKQVRTGLIHDLLTRGLDERGQLRDPIAHPEQFQDSPLGRIPREWRVCGVLDVAPSNRQAILTGPFGAQLGQADFVREGIPVLRIGNVQSGYIDLSDLQFVTEEKAQMLERFRIKCGDLLFARQGATTGRNALADERVEGYVINYHIIRVAVNRDSCSPIFLHALFNSENVQRQINRDKGRGTREGINTGEITALRFALPPIEEQHCAVAVMRVQSQLVEAEEELLGKLHLIKSGLMSDLLTGRVRVPEEIVVAP